MPSSVPITVLMPVHDGRRYLRAAVRSILAQDFPDFELLVIDDGCVDGSERILRQIDDPRVRVIRQANRGIVAALNAGLEAARGELIARMDADDLAAPNRLSLQLRFLRQHPQVHLLGSRFMYIDARNQSLFSPDWPIEDADIRAALPVFNCFIHPTVMFRRRSVLEAGGYRPQVQLQEDYDLWLRLVERHQVAQLPQVLLYYRLSSESLSYRNRRRQSTVLDALVKELSLQRQNQGRDVLDRGEDLNPTLRRLEAGATRATHCRRWSKQMYRIGQGCLLAGRRARALRYALEAVWYEPASRWNWGLLSRSVMPEWVHDSAADVRRELSGRRRWSRRAAAPRWDAPRDFGTVSAQDPAEEPSADERIHALTNGGPTRAPDTCMGSHL